jgi:hypothetical protein
MSDNLNYEIEVLKHFPDAEIYTNTVMQTYDIRWSLDYISYNVFTADLYSSKKDTPEKAWKSFYDLHIKKHTEMNNDIGKCSNSECILKENCKRWTYRSTSINQSYHMFEPVNNKCEHQIK